MITKETFSNLKIWFTDFTSDYCAKHALYTENFNLKIEHTKRVQKEIVNICTSLNLNKNDMYIAETVALLHDVGRFEQFSKYETFADNKSVNHASLGVKIIKEYGILSEVDEFTKELILKVIGFHNCKTIPENENTESLFFLKLLRDADKLDILYVVTDYYLNREKKRNRSIELELPDIPNISNSVLDSVKTGNMVNVEDLKTLNDFKVLQMSWVFDINFPYTLKSIRGRKYLEIIRGTITTKKERDIIFSIAMSYLKEHL